jgi:dihydrofolate reductase
MGKLVVGTFLTLDGVYQAPGGQDEDREGGFEHGGWLANFFDEEMGSRIVDLTTASDALLLGRKTYEIFAGYWPNADQSDPVAAHLNNVPKYVASRTLDTVGWNNSTLIDGDVAEKVAELKERYDQVGVTGSGALIQTLLEADLVDVFGLWFFPVVIGSGKRLFGDGTIPGALKLTDSWTSATGVILTTYERAGAIPYGEAG